MNQTRDPDFVEPQIDKVVTYTAELNHKLNMRWNILSFLSTSYSINIRRDMFGGGDREAFVKENFFSFDEGGLFASGYIFDHDHSDRKVYISRDSLVIIPVDTIAKTNAKGEALPIDMQNADTYEIRYDTTSFYKVDSVGHREYGRAYGILRNERSRNQQFRINFNPKLIPFIPFNMQFSSDFNQQKSIPDDFSFTIVWGTYGISSYDSKTGVLIKSKDATDVSRYTTTYKASNEVLFKIYELLFDKIKINSYPDEYDPFNSPDAETRISSSPNQTIIISVTAYGEEKTVRCENICFGSIGYDERATQFLEAEFAIVDFLTRTDEWQALPEYEVFYD